MRRLADSWPPPTKFNVQNLKERITWFPTWWLKDMTAEGILIADGEGNYCVNAEGRFKDYLALKSTASVDGLADMAG